MRVAGIKKMKITGRHKLTFWKAKELKGKFYKFLKKNPKGRGLN